MTPGHAVGDDGGEQRLDPAEKRDGDGQGREFDKLAAGYFGKGRRGQPPGHAAELRADRLDRKSKAQTARPPSAIAARHPGKRGFQVRRIRMKASDPAASPMAGVEAEGSAGPKGFKLLEKVRRLVRDLEPQ